MERNKESDKMEKGKEMPQLFFVDIFFKNAVFVIFSFTINK